MSNPVNNYLDKEIVKENARYVLVPDSPPRWKEIARMGVELAAVVVLILAAIGVWQ